jgi:hypothetical protein
MIRMRFRPSMLALVVVVAVAPASSEAASSCVAPPGTSAIDQYCEVVPNGAGGSSGSGGSGGPKTPGISSQTQSRLSRSGTDGQALAALAGASDPSPAAPKKARRETSSGSKTSTKVPRDRSTSSAASSNVLQAAARSAGDQTNRVGTTFAVALVGGLLIMGGWGWVRFRRSSVA